jgi:hypothetical protein
VEFGEVSRSLVSRKCGRPNVLLFISKKSDFCRRSIRIFVFYSSDGSNIPGDSSNTSIEGMCGVLWDMGVPSVQEMWQTKYLSLYFQGKRFL